MKLPENEIRKFSSNKLKNNIKYTIVHDKNIKNASVCVCIKAGSFNNPKDYHGLAHFLEHMLFLGSKKYPKENHFEESLKCHGGSTNAYTASYETVYYFSVNNKYLEKIMDIFSRFFIDPLFSKDSVSREINAIHSEHMKNYNNDLWRLNHFVNTISKKDSIMNRFTTGSLETLDKPDIRDKMIEFYNNYYCSDNMTITVISPDEIESVEKIFTNIFNNIPSKKSIENTIIKKEPYFDNKNIEYQIIPIVDTINIYYIWEIPLKLNFLKNKIFSIIDYVIEDDSENNLEQILFKKNLIKTLSCYVLDGGLFILNIYINREYSDNIKETIKIINQYVKYYIDHLEKLDWNKIYDYIQKKNLLLFNNSKISDELDLIDDITINMHYYTKEYYYSGDKIIIDKEYDILKEELKNIKFYNCFIIYSLQEELEKASFQTESIYKTKYHILNNSLISNEIKFDFSINLDNNYINIKPKNVEDLDKNKYPKLLSKRLWYGGMSKFNNPKIIGNILMDNGKLFNNLEKFVISLLSINVINYKISKQFSKEFELGYIFLYSYNLITSSIYININGFNDKYNLFFDECINYLKSFKNDINNLDNIILIHLNHMKENLKNISKSNPWELSDIILKEKVIKNNYSYIDRLDYINKINSTDLIKLIKLNIENIILFKDFSISFLFYGNLNKTSIPNLDNFNINIELPQNNILKSDKIVDIKMSHPNKEETNNLFMLTYYSGKFSPNKNTMLILLSIIMEQPCYDFLRTKKQLGYLVKSGITKYYPNYYLYIKVQSTKSLKEVENNVNTFINNYNKILEEIDLDKYKKTVKELLEVKETSIAELNLKFLNEIKYKKYLFRREELLLKELDKISKNDIIKFFNTIKENKKIILINSN